MKVLNLAIKRCRAAVCEIGVAHIFRRTETEEGVAKIAHPKHSFSSFPIVIPFEGYITFTIIPKMWPPLCQLILVSVILNCISKTAAQPTRISERQNFPAIVQSVPGTVHRICQPNILSPVIKCACYTYSPLFTEDEDIRSQNMRKFCLEILPHSPQSGHGSCRNTSFMRSGGRINTAVMNDYFRDIVEGCIYLPQRYPGQGSLSEAETRVKTKEKTNMWNEQYSMTSPLGRQQSNAVQSALENFCIVLLYHRNYSRERADERCRATPSPRRRIASSLCEQNVMKAATECGCKVYLDYYERGTRWEPLDRACHLDAGNHRQPRSKSCSTFMTSLHGDIPFKLTALEDYMEEACKSCTGKESKLCGNLAVVHQHRVSTLRLRQFLLDFCLVSAEIHGGSVLACRN